MSVIGRRDRKAGRRAGLRPRARVPGRRQAPVARSRSRTRCPSDVQPDRGEPPDASADDGEAFGPQQRGLPRLVAAVAAERAAGRDHPVGGHCRGPQLAMSVPTARAAPGRPAAAATSPYVATRPAGIARTASNTRSANDFTVARVSGRDLEGQTDASCPASLRPATCARPPSARVIRLTIPSCGCPALRCRCPTPFPIRDATRSDPRSPIPGSDTRTPV